MHSLHIISQALKLTDFPWDSAKESSDFCFICQIKNEIKHWLTEIHSESYFSVMYDSTMKSESGIQRITENPLISVPAQL